MNRPTMPQRNSLVAQTVQSLCGGIETGLWRGHLPGERELCKHLQVSRPTVRAALKELQRMGWLLSALRQRRRIAARRTKPGTGTTKHVVAVLAPLTLRAMSLTVVLVIDSVREQFARIGWTMNLLVNRSCFSARPARALEKVVRGAPAAAWLLFGSGKPMLNWFVRNAVPCLVAGTCPEDIALPFADADHRAACRHAGAFFLRAGHRRLALVLPQDTGGGDSESERGLREALALDADLLVLRHRGKAHLCVQLDRALRSPAPPTAYLVARAFHALTVATHLQRRGVRLPEDAAVVSRDDEPFLCHTSPTLSRYAVNPEHFARQVSRAVRQLAETGTLPARAIWLMPKYLPGETA